MHDISDSDIHWLLMAVKSQSLSNTDHPMIGLTLSLKVDIIFYIFGYNINPIVKMLLGRYFYSTAGCTFC